MSTWRFHADFIPGDRGTELYTRKHKLDADTDTDYVDVFVGETSNNRFDWFTNFSFLKARLFPESADTAKQAIRGHFGFLLYAHICMHIIKSKKIITKKTQTVRLYGASQGGGIALILAGLIKGLYPRISIEVKTYGAPAVGNRALVQYIRDNCVVRRRFIPIDLVANAPYWIVGLRHVGRVTVYKTQKWWRIFKIIQNHRDICEQAYSDLGIVERSV